MRIGIVGAGAIGGYLAVALSAAGEDVVLVGRRQLDDKERMQLEPRHGAPLAAGATLSVTRRLDTLAEVDLCLVAVKAQDTATLATQLAGVLAEATPVISFQNGLRNLERLRARLSSPVIGAVVNFNVVREGTLRRQTSRGKLLIESAVGRAGASLRQLRAAFERAGVEVETRRDMERTIAGKLLVNLGNGVAAACGLPSAELLASRDARWCFSQCLDEGLAVMRQADCSPRSVMVVPPSWMARGLRLPDRLLKPLAKAFRSTDPSARASTLQDLERGVATEIEELNGAIVWLAARSGRQAPINELVTSVVHAHEHAVLAGAEPRFLTPAELRRRMEPLLEGRRADGFGETAAGEGR